MAECVPRTTGNAGTMPRVPLRRAAVLTTTLLLALAASPAGAAVPRTLRVCAKGTGCIKSIQRAVTLSRPGDTISIAPGVYRESVLIRGRKHAALTLKGSPGVILDGSALPAGTPAGIAIQLTNDVSVSALTVRTFPRAGVTISGSTSIRLSRLTLHHTGDYGLRVTSSTGGVYDGLEAYAARTAAVSIAATPPQEKPRRTYVRTLSAHESPIGFEAINARYVTLTHARLFNNGTGIALTASSALPNAPVEDNLIRANDVFWNNYDTTSGEKGIVPPHPAAPTGAGIFLFGSRANVLELNHVYGNWLVGLGASPNYLMALATPGSDLGDLRRNVVRLNEFGLDGRDRNGRDIAYDGSGRGNCFEDNRDVRTTVPQDGATLVPCLPPTANVDQPLAFEELRSWSDPTDHWIRHSHAARPGVRPLEQPPDTATPAARAVR